MARCSSGANLINVCLSSWSLFIYPFYAHILITKSLITIFTLRNQFIEGLYTPLVPWNTLHGIGLLSLVLWVRYEVFRHRQVESHDETQKDACYLDYHIIPPVSCPPSMSLSLFWL
ncbi:hypothetical protein I308_105194 [Cryptococcus tetragattii IND107]|uniref:Uncharacterized protein n=1 Tax=Cryptococcus tetragattii IND107 TaxID=1296105 RepID=A0ABR3BND5_9TREE